MMMTCKVSKVKTFRDKYLRDLEKQINDFIALKDVINVSFSVIKNGFDSEYMAIVAYKE
jgi:hypothetical protein